MRELLVIVFAAFAMQGCSHVMPYTDWNQNDVQGMPHFEFSYNSIIRGYYVSDEVLITKWVKGRSVCENYADKYEIYDRKTNINDNTLTVFGRCVQ